MALNESTTLASSSEDFGRCPLFLPFSSLPLFRNQKFTPRTKTCAGGTSAIDPIILILRSIREKKKMSSGLGGLNKSKNGVVIGLVQLQLPVVKTPDDLAKQTDRIVELVGKARRNNPAMDLVVFPEYMLHGLSMDTNDDIMCDRQGKEMQACAQACRQHRIWGCFSIMERNHAAPENPFNSGLIFNDKGEEVLYYRKLHPWCPVEP